MRRRLTPSHSTRGNKRYRYYVCGNAQKRGWKTCPSPSISAGEIERFVVEQIRCIGSDPQLIAETIRQAQTHVTKRADELAVETRRLELELAQHHRDMENLVRTPGANDDLASARFADFQERIAAAERRLSEVRDEAEKVACETIDEADAANALAQFDPVWDSLNPREQGRLLQLLIERIDYDGQDGTLSFTFHASGIKSLAQHELAGKTA